MDMQRCLVPALFGLFPIRRSLSLPMSGNLWHMLSLESVESTEKQQSPVSAQHQSHYC